MKDQNYYLGLDIGTDSIGYAVTSADASYKIPKFHGEPMWGVTLFEEGKLRDERRAFRTARRRLDRRQQRIKLLQEIFAPEIAKIDPRFFVRIKESALLREDSQEEYYLFADKDFKDRDYHKKYPTIHHLICALMDPAGPFDVRLVYLAAAWIAAHRGHFLSEISEENIENAVAFSPLYHSFLDFMKESGDGQTLPWDKQDEKALQEALTEKGSVRERTARLTNALFTSGKIPKPTEDDAFPFDLACIIKLLAHGQCQLADLFCNPEYKELGSFKLDKADEEYEKTAAEIGDDAALLFKLKELYDWTILSDLLKGNGNHSGNRMISQAKCEIYETHQKDLKTLKYFVRKYLPKEKYAEVFRRATVAGSKICNYVAYSKNLKNARGDRSKFQACKIEEFSEYLLKLFQNVAPDQKDRERFEDMTRRLQKDSLSFLPKQVNGDNRVIPYQLYYVELKKILKNAENYLPFLKEKDADGYTAEDKILSIIKFRVPYFVGPIHSETYGWIKEKPQGRITPWNFENQIDLEKAEDAFIRKMTNTCSYLPGEEVLPKHSLLYEKFEVLNEINNLKINGNPILVSTKQEIFTQCFCKHKKVTMKTIRDYLISTGIGKEDANTLSGADEAIHSSLSTFHAFKSLMQNGKLKEEDVERIVKHKTCTENRFRFEKWLGKNYPDLSAKDQRYVSSLTIKDFGRLSEKLLCGLEGVNKQSGECDTILHFLWETNDNLSHLLLSEERYNFAELIDQNAQQYSAENPRGLDARLDEMYLSNSVKRQIYRTLDVVNDVVKASGKAPEKIFIEMARGGKEEEKGKRSVSRKDQILELYRKVKDEDVKELNRQLEEMGDEAGSRLQSDVLFLYYMQLGKCMYTGKKIDIAKLRTSEYNIDHIYPQSLVKDDSILNNKVLVLSEENGRKSGRYPVEKEIRERMKPYWAALLKNGSITKEKYDRLTRSTPFSPDEKWGFINRQLVETRQSTKAVAELLKEKYPESKIVYVKANLASEFRRLYGFVKSRSLNDLHHAKDAYLNVVCGNTYTEHFTQNWFQKVNAENASYNVKMEKLLGEYKDTPDPERIFEGHTVKNGNQTVWNGKESFDSVCKTLRGNAIHLTEYAFCKHGGLFNQMPLSKRGDLIPRKAGLDPAKYGGYNGAGISFFMLCGYTVKRKKEAMLVPVEVMAGKKILQDEDLAERYLKSRILKIKNFEPETLSFPLGLRPLKIHTAFWMDGLIYGLSGSDSNGQKIVLTVLTPLLLSSDQERYLARVEKYAEKCRANKQYFYDAKYDKVNKEENEKLYLALQSKYETTLLKKRIASPLEILQKGFEEFQALSIKDQCDALLHIVETFSRSGRGGCDLRFTESGGEHSGKSACSAFLSNWKKTYQNVYILDRSSAGLWEKRSDNLLDLV